MRAGVHLRLDEAILLLERSSCVIIEADDEPTRDLDPTLLDAVDRLQTTAESHDRVMVLEVMGRYAGWIALAGHAV
mgnify:CR=1 FL=1